MENEKESLELLFRVTEIVRKRKRLFFLLTILLFFIILYVYSAILDIPTFMYFLSPRIILFAFFVVVLPDVMKLLRKARILEPVSKYFESLSKVAKAFFMISLLSLLFYLITFPIPSDIYRCYIGPDTSGYGTEAGHAVCLRRHAESSGISVCDLLSNWVDFCKTTSLSTVLNYHYLFICKDIENDFTSWECNVDKTSSLP